MAGCVRLRVGHHAAGKFGNVGELQGKLQASRFEERSLEHPFHQLR
jgi:hypothetical protein